MCRHRTLSVARNGSIWEWTCQDCGDQWTTFAHTEVEHYQQILKLWNYHIDYDIP